MPVLPQKNNNIKILKLVLAAKMLVNNVEKTKTKKRHIAVISSPRQLALCTEEVQQRVFLFVQVAFSINPIHIYK